MTNNPIEHIKTRIKSPESIVRKMSKLGGTLIEELEDDLKSNKNMKHTEIKMLEPPPEFVNEIIEMM